MSKFVYDIVDHTHGSIHASRLVLFSVLESRALNDADHGLVKIAWRHLKQAVHSLEQLERSAEEKQEAGPPASSELVRLKPH